MVLFGDSVGNPQAQDDSDAADSGHKLTATQPCGGRHANRCRLWFSSTSQMSLRRPECDGLLVTDGFGPDGLTFGCGPEAGGLSASLMRSGFDGMIAASANVVVTAAQVVHSRVLSMWRSGER